MLDADRNPKQANKKQSKQIKSSSEFEKPHKKHKIKHSYQSTTSSATGLKSEIRRKSTASSTFTLSGDENAQPDPPKTSAVSLPAAAARNNGPKAFAPFVSLP